MTEATAKSRDVILREDDFVPLLKSASDAFGGRVLRQVSDPAWLGSFSAVTRSAQQADDVERFIDHFGGRHNQTFATFGELVASARGLLLAKATALHVDGRLPRYDLVLEPPQMAALGEALSGCVSTLDRSILAVLDALRQEAERLGLGWVAAADGVEDGLDQRRLLPRNIDIENATDEQEHIAEVGARFLKMVQASRNLDLTRVREPAELPSYVAEFATEERCRWYESAAHNIQSMYDTYVSRTSMEADHPWLKAIRGHASVCLHLLEMATGLMHFYQRHENDIRHEPASEAISSVVSKEDVLHLVVNVCLRQAYLIVEAATGVAERVLETFVRQGVASLSMPEGVVLHARPLALVVQIARHYGTPLEVTLNGETGEGTSLMSLIILGGKHPKPDTIEVRGDSRALSDIELLFESGLGESGTLPAALDYLRTH